MGAISLSDDVRRQQGLLCLEHCVLGAPGAGILAAFLNLSSSKKCLPPRIYAARTHQLHNTNWDTQTLTTVAPPSSPNHNIRRGPVDDDDDDVVGRPSFASVQVDGIVILRASFIITHRTVFYVYQRN